MELFVVLLGVALVDVCARFNFTFVVDVVVVDELYEAPGDIVDSDEGETGDKLFLRLFTFNCFLHKKPGSNRDDVDADSGLDCPDVEDDVSSPVDVNFTAGVTSFFPLLKRLSASSSCDVPVSKHMDFRF